MIISISSSIDIGQQRLPAIRQRKVTSLVLAFNSDTRCAIVVTNATA